MEYLSHILLSNQGFVTEAQAFDAAFRKDHFINRHALVPKALLLQDVKEKPLVALQGISSCFVHLINLADVQGL